MLHFSLFFFSVSGMYLRISCLGDVGSDTGGAEGRGFIPPTVTIDI